MLARTRHTERGLVGPALRQELQRKQLPPQIIAQAMEEVTTESAYQTAQYLVEKKLRTLKNHPRDVQYRRLLGMLARKGYSGNIANQAISTALKTLEEHDNE